MTFWDWWAAHPASGWVLVFVVTIVVYEALDKVRK